MKGFSPILAYSAMKRIFGAFFGIVNMFIPSVANGSTGISNIYRLGVLADEIDSVHRLSFLSVPCPWVLDTPQGFSISLYIFP